MAEQDKQADSANGRVKRVQAGVVVSAAMDKTIVVRIDRRTKHSLYKKYIRRSTRLKVHDPDNQCGVGDLVEIREGRLMAKHKSWVLDRVVEAASDLQATG